MAIHFKSSKIFSIDRMIDILHKLATISVVILLLSNLSPVVKSQDYEDLNPNSEATPNGASNGKSVPQFGRGSTTNQQATINQANSNQERDNSQQVGKQQVEQNGRNSHGNSEESSPSELINDQQTNGTSSGGNNAGVHDTVYSDQRFASLFARRNQGKKLRPPPSEPIKAKPTLPSFIKSPPDLAMFQQTTPQPSSNSASQRLQQQQRQQTSVNNQRSFNNNNTSNNANKNSNINQRTTPAVTPNKNKLNSNSNNAAAGGKVSTPAPAIKPLVNRFPSNSNNDNSQSNLIAQARKRFLANSALQNSAAKARAQPSNNQQP